MRLRLHAFATMLAALLYMDVAPFHGCGCGPTRHRGAADPTDAGAPATDGGAGHEHASDAGPPAPLPPA